jgi:hypothetical protein
MGEEEAEEQMDWGRPPSLSSFGSYLTGVIVIDAAGEAAFEADACCLGDEEEDEDESVWCIIIVAS